MNDETDVAPAVQTVAVDPRGQTAAVVPARQTVSVEAVQRPTDADQLTTFDIVFDSAFT